MIFSQIHAGCFVRAADKTYTKSTIDTARPIRPVSRMAGWDQSSRNFDSFPVVWESTASVFQVSRITPAGPGPPGTARNRKRPSGRRHPSFLLDADTAEARIVIFSGPPAWHVSVTSGLQTFFLVAFHGIGRHGKDRHGNPSERSC